MFKRLRRSLLKKFYGENPFLSNVLRKNFSKSPLKYTALSLYLLPVRKMLRLNEYSKSRTFIVSKDYLEQFHSLLHIGKAEGFNLIRIGDYCGYIMLDDFHAGGVAYSFGIGDDVSWDRDMASRGYDVFMYDHTIDGLPEKNPRFHYFREGIGDGSGENEKLKTLEEYITRNGHEEQRDMILKMDVEGAEWGFLESVKPETLAQFRQITFELHGMLNGKFPFEQVLELLKKLNKTHQLIHLHPCNWGLSYFSWGNKNWFNTMEASYIRRDSYTISDDYAENLPLSIDRPDAYEWPDIGLGCWNDSIEYGDMITSTVNIL